MNLVSLGSLLAMVLVLTMSISTSVDTLTRTLRISFASLEQTTLQTPSEAALLLAGLMRNVLVVVVPVLLLFTVGGVVGSLVQNIPSASWERVAPKMNRLSPSKNMSRIIGKEATIEFMKTAAKFVALCVLIYYVLKGKIADLFNIGLGDPASIPNVLKQTALDIVTPAAVFVLLLAIADMVWDSSQVVERLEDDATRAKG